MDHGSHAPLPALAAEFWAWRVRTVPDSYDDITRVERPPGWVADWSAEAVRDRRAALAGFTARLDGIDCSGADPGTRVDARLLGSALARVRWELDELRTWQRDPSFYVDQSLVCVYNLLLRPPPFDPERTDAVVSRLRNVPVVLEQARENLAGSVVAGFARRALAVLDGADDRLRTAMAALAAVLPDRRLGAAAETAARSVAGYRDWLARHGSLGSGDTAVGAEAFAFLLHRVALLPYAAEQLRAMGRQEQDRTAWAELLHRGRPADRSARLPGTAEVIARQSAAEEDLRRFYVERGLLTQPAGLRRYRMAPMPAYLETLTWLGVAHETAAPSRAGDDALRYIRRPRADLPYFELSEIHDPRVGLAHDGVHAQQLALSWRHPDPARRHYYDSAPNEGLALYHEELLLTMGVFDDAPASAAFIRNAARLRALRVEVDVALALGELTLPGAAELLAEAVPMDRATAWQEAAFFAANPGQGSSYQIGKLQILDLLATCARRHGDAFDLMAFHDRLWREGNVPLTLQRWELLGLRDQLDRADRLAAELTAPGSARSTPVAPPPP